MKTKAAKVPYDAVTDTRIRATDLRVLCLLCLRAGDKRWCTAKQTVLARDLRRSRGAIQASLNRLKRAKYIEIRNRTRVNGKIVYHPFSAHTYHILAGSEAQ